jgi:hypothetical protein
MIDVALSTFAVLRRSFGSVNKTDWNVFAALCDGGYRSSFRFLHATHVLRWPRTRIHLYEIHTKKGGQTIKIAQAAIRKTGNTFFFEDKLQILPGHEVDWCAIMTVLIGKIGPGDYCYGSLLNLEPSRHSDIATLPGVVINNCREIVVQYVDFAKWDSWEAYHSAISTNSKRNAKRAQTENAGIGFREARGLATLKGMGYLLKSREEMYSSKVIQFEKVRAALSYLGRIIGSGDQAFSAFITANSGYLASMSGVVFDNKTYYLDGGRRMAPRGASWFLMIEMLRTCYQRCAKGKFIMGYVDYALHDDNIGGGLLRSRQSCRTTDQPTSVVTFSVKTT